MEGFEDMNASATVFLEVMMLKLSGTVKIRCSDYLSVQLATCDWQDAA